MDCDIPFSRYTTMPTTCSSSHAQPTAPVPPKQARKRTVSTLSTQSNPSDKKKVKAAQDDDGDIAIDKGKRGPKSR